MYCHAVREGVKKIIVADYMMSVTSPPPVWEKTVDTDKKVMFFIKFFDMNINRSRMG